MKLYKRLIIIIGIVFSPFLIEFFLFNIPSISKFSREAWFSFIGSYSGAIVTLIVLQLTLKENRRSITAERTHLKRIYEIEKEINLSKGILDVLLLNNYDFISLDKITNEYARYIANLYDVQFDVRELTYNDSGDTARDRFFNELYLTERYHTLQLFVEEKIQIESKEQANKYLDFVIEKTTTLSRQMNTKRQMLLGLYKEYVNEIQEKKFESYL